MRALNRLVWIGTAAVLVFAMRSVRVTAMDQYLETQRYEDVYYLPPAEALPIVSLGYDRALADLIWMKALVYVGDEFVEDGNVDNVFRYGDAIVTLDPDFKRVYRWVGTMGIYRPQGGVSAEDAWRTVDFLERAARRWPDDGTIAWDLGATLAYELPMFVDMPREELERRAIPHFMTAVRLGDSPEWMTLTNVRMLRDLGENERAVAHLEEMYATVEDAETRRSIELELAQLRGEGHAAALRAAREHLLERHQAEYPWLPPSFYLLVGPRPLVDSNALHERRFLPAVPESDLE